MAGGKTIWERSHGMRMITMFNMYNEDGYAYAAMAGTECRCSGRVFRTEYGGGHPWEEFIIGSNRWALSPNDCYADGYRLIDPFTAGQLISVRTILLKQAVSDATRLAKQAAKTRMLSISDGGSMRYSMPLSTERIAIVADACTDLDAKAATWLHGACLVGVSVGKLGRIGFPNDVVGAVRILVDGTPQNGAQDDENGAAMAAEERIASEVLAALSSRYPDFLMFGRNGGIPREATA